MTLLRLHARRFAFFSIAAGLSLVACTSARGYSESEASSEAESELAGVGEEESAAADDSTVAEEEVSPQEDEKKLEAMLATDVDPKSQKEIEEEILAADAELEDETKPEKNASKPKIPIEINERVRKWIHYFTTTDRARFERFLRRGSAYRETIETILKKHGVPKDIYYLGMVESGYSTRARSRARAVGPWQFMPGTGKLYGLKQNYYVDERQDIVRATEAAARYLRGLHTAFQSWYLAMAGYNAGEGRILGAVVRANSRDYWDLVEKKSLPSETRNYVPKVLAAIIIGRHPDKYGFKNIEEDAFPDYEGVEVPGGVSLSKIASKTGIQLSMLKKLNPHLRRGMTPASSKTYTLWVPDGRAGVVADARSALEKYRVRAKKTRSLASRKGYHIVRRGQSLSTIARRYGISVARLKRLNGLRSSKIQAGKRLRIASN